MYITLLSFLNKNKFGGILSEDQSLFIQENPQDQEWISPEKQSFWLSWARLAEIKLFNYYVPLRCTTSSIFTAEDQLRPDTW